MADWPTTLWTVALSGEIASARVEPSPDPLKKMPSKQDLRVDSSIQPFSIYSDVHPRPTTKERKQEPQSRTEM